MTVRLKSIMGIALWQERVDKYFERAVLGLKLQQFMDSGETF